MFAGIAVSSQTVKPQLLNRNHRNVIRQIGAVSIWEAKCGGLPGIYRGGRGGGGITRPYPGSPRAGLSGYLRGTMPGHAPAGLPQPCPDPGPRGRPSHPPSLGRPRTITLPGKAKRQYLLTLQVSRYWLLALHGTSPPSPVHQQSTLFVDNGINVSRIGFNRLASYRVTLQAVCSQRSLKLTQKTQQCCLNAAPTVYTLAQQSASNDQLNYC